jgi:hypothetical protein
VNLSGQLVAAIRSELAMHLPNEMRRGRSSLMGAHAQPSAGFLLRVASNGNNNNTTHVHAHGSVHVGGTTIPHLPIGNSSAGIIPPSPIPRSIVPMPSSTVAPAPSIVTVRLPAIRPNIFGDALHEVMNMLEHDVLPRYLKSELYQEYRRSLQLQ